MESVLGRYRNLTILVGVLFLQVLGLAVQVKRSADAENTRLIRIWAVDAITPFERALVWAQNGGSNLWRNYFFLRGVRAEHRLQQLLAFKEQVIARTVPAQVIGSSGSDLSRSIYIDKGSNEGIATDMAVITAGGIVGKVLRVYPSTSLVLMINDQTSGVGAMLEKSRLQGVLRGTPDGEVILERVMSDEKVEPGDTVLSSGGDQIFPKGLPVGTVIKVSPGREMFLNIQVKPATDLSRLEEVLVVTEKQEHNAVVDSGVRVRAADILAQRLPSVPDKPVENGAAAATSAPGNNRVAAPAQTANPAAKPQTPAATSAKPGAVQRVATPTTAKVPSAQLPAAAVSDGAGSTGTSPHGVDDGGKPTASQAPKKTAPHVASGEAALSSGSPNGPGLKVATKPASDRPKPALARPSPQPFATEDGPH